MSRLHILAAVCCAALLSAAPGLGDVVTLNDGSRLVGTIERMAGGKLKLTTTYAGVLEIDAALVASIESESRINVGTTGGDTLVGPVSALGDQLTVDTQQGAISVPLVNVTAVWPEGAASPEQEILAQQLEEERKKAEEAAGRWSATIEAGYLQQDGNSDLLSARGRAELRKKSTRDLLKFYVSGEYAENQQIRSAAEAKAGAYYEYLMTDRFYLFGSLDLEYDEFELLDLRLIAVAGPGYYWLKEPEHELKTSIAAGYLHESFQDNVTNDEAILQLAANYRVDIKPWLRFTNDTYYYPTFAGLDDYRITNDSGLLVPLGESDTWKFKFGVLLEYDPIPRPGLERLDITYYANLVADLK